MNNIKNNLFFSAFLNFLSTKVYCKKEMKTVTNIALIFPKE